MQRRVSGTALLLAFAIPSVASADILLQNKDRKGYGLAIRHSTSTTTMSLPAGSYLVVTEGAMSVQLRDGAGNAKGDAVEVIDGDRLEVRGGKLVKKQVRASND